MNIRITTADAGTAQKLASALKGFSLVEKPSEADLIFVFYREEEYSLPHCGIPGFEEKKAKMIRAILNMVCYARDLDALAEEYKKSVRPASVVHMGAYADLAVAYLHKKHNILSYALAPEYPSISAALAEDTGIGVCSIKAAGVNDMLWVYEAKDSAGKDLLPALRGAAKEEKLDVSRFALTLEPKKSLAFYGYYHSAKVQKKDSASEAARLAEALASPSPAVIPLYAVNKEYIYGLDEVPVCVPCTVSSGGILPGKVELPLQCVLASNDYAGALLTAASALSKRSVHVFKRAIKLDPYIASLLTLDEAESLAENILKSNKEAAEFFGGRI
jgi:hypothetical protein